MSLDWTKLNAQKSRLDEKLSKGGGTRAKFWKPDPGKNLIRVMPSWTDKGEFAGQFWREISQHWNVSPEQKGPVICVKQTPGLEGDCPICQFYEALKADKSDPEAQQTAKEIRPKTAYFLNVVDLNDKEYTARDVAEFKQARPSDDVPFEAGDIKVQIYACPSTVFNQILGNIQVNQVDITDAKEGHDITLTKTGSGLTTRYEVQVMMRASEAPPVEELPALDEVGYEMSHGEMTQLLASGAGAAFASKLALPTGSRQTASPPDEDLTDEEELRRQMLAAAAD